MTRVIDITGQRFGMLTAIKPLSKRQHKEIVWFCICDCGKNKKVMSSNLRTGNTKSCGCFHRKRCGQMGKETLHNLAGRKFGKLLVLKIAKKRSSNGGVRWVCRCDCGGQKTVAAGCLKKGNVKSCGCWSRDKLKNSIDLTGRKFGRLTVLCPTKKRLQTSVMWKCRCDCGNICTVSGPALKRNTRSCGCYRTAFMMTRFSSLEPEDIPYAVIKVKQNQGKIINFRKEVV